MIVTKRGKTLIFDCGMCESEFIAGIHSAKTTDNGENYYCICPVCGNECHTDIVRQDIKKKKEVNSYDKK